MSQTLFLIGFYIFVLVFGIALFRFLVPRDYKKHGKLSPVVTFLQVMLFSTHGWLLYFYEINTWPSISVGPFLYGIGLVLSITGISGLFYGMFRLGIARAFGRGESKLIRAGIYRYSRNPQVLFYGVGVIGFAILWSSWYAAAWIFLHGALIHWMVLAEEEHLLRTHGETYADYCQDVPRYFGKVV